MIKTLKDFSIKLLLGRHAIPSGLLELNQYMRHSGPIRFDVQQTADGQWVARSVDFQYGAIITTAASEAGLDKALQDAILMSFEIPSSYAKEAQLVLA